LVSWFNKHTSPNGWRAVLRLRPENQYAKGLAHLLGQGLFESTLDDGFGELAPKHDVARWMYVATA
jgi:hypothetical protein